MNNRLVFVLTVAVLLLTACVPAAAPTPLAAPTSPAVPPAAPATAAPATKATAPVAAAKKGGTLTYALSSDIFSFDPHNTTELISGMVNVQVFDYLTRLDENGQAQPSLAKSWSISADQLTWTFRLVQGAKFHDGTPVNAESVKKNLDRIIAPDSKLPAKAVLLGVKEIKVADDSTIQILTDAPFGPLPQNLSHYSLGIISPAALAKYDAKGLSQNPVGSGPFKFVSYTPSESIILERNGNYWGQVPYVDKVVFKPVPESATRVVMLETGQADIVTKIPAVEVQRLQGNPNFSVDVVPFNRVFFIQLHTQRKPLTDARVRQALNYAIDKEAIAKSIFRGLVKVATGPISNKVFGYASTPTYDYNPTKAKQLLADAGYASGIKLTMAVPQGRYLGGEETATAVQAYLAQVGVQVEIRIVEWAAFLNDRKVTADKAKYDMIFIGFSPSTNDSDWMIYSHYHCKSLAPASNNNSYTCDPKLDELIDRGRFTVDAEKRKPIYKEILTWVASQATDIFLFEEAQITGQRKNVHGLLYLPVEVFHLEDVWKD